MTREKKFLAFEAFAMYLLTGALMLVIGTNLGRYAVQFGLTLEKAAIFASVYSLGRVSTVYLTGYLTERLGVQRVLAIGVSLILLFLVGISFTQVFLVGCICCFLGGMGMGAQDACCPMIMRGSFPKSYASALSAGQAFFGAGSFLHPFLTGVALKTGQSYRMGNYLFMAVCVVMLVLLPFTGKQLVAGRQEGSTGLPALSGLPRAGRQFALLLLINFAYCAGINTIGMFTVTYGQHIDLSQELAPLILSCYSAGNMVGCIIFVLILRAVAAEKVFISNFSIAVGALFCVLLTRNPAILAVCYFASGFVLGVLFSIIITFATQLFPQAPGRAAALIAISGGGADVLAPLVLSRLMPHFGQGIIVPYSMVLLTLALGCSLWFAKMKER